MQIGGRAEAVSNPIRDHDSRRGHLRGRHGVTLAWALGPTSPDHTIPRGSISQKNSKNQDQVMALLFAFPMVETTLPQIALYGGEDLGGKCQQGTKQLQVINCTAIVSATRHNISHRYRQRRLGWLHPPSRFYISQIDLG